MEARFYLSFGASGRVLIGTRTVPPLAPGAESSATATVTMPSGHLGSNPGGDYFLRACADGASTEIEANELNNCRASRTTVRIVKAHLVISALSDPPPTTRPGATFSVTDMVVNQGSVEAGASTTRYYLSPREGRSEFQILIGSREVARLEPATNPRAP